MAASAGSHHTSGNSAVSTGGGCPSESSPTSTVPSTAPKVIVNSTTPTPANRAPPEARWPWASSSTASTSAKPGSRMISPLASGIHSMNEG